MLTGGAARGLGGTCPTQPILLKEALTLWHKSSQLKAQSIIKEQGPDVISSDACLTAMLNGSIDSVCKTGKVRDFSFNVFLYFGLTALENRTPDMDDV